jgi:hypothetical protein
MLLAAAIGIWHQRFAVEAEARSAMDIGAKRSDMRIL